MSGDGNYKNLIVWQKSINLVKLIYKLTEKFPAGEKFGLTSQMRRAVISIPSNIAEGQARRTTKDYIRFVSTSEGSLAELETQLIISIELDFCSKPETETCFDLMLEIKKNAERPAYQPDEKIKRILTKRETNSRLSSLFPFPF